MFVDNGKVLSLLNEPQSNVPIETIIITATSAAIGMSLSISLKKTTKISRKNPAINVDNLFFRQSLYL